MLEAFYHDMKKFEDALLSSDGFLRIAVAVSGGPDSMALCALLREWNAQRSEPVEIHALTVDHRLRPEAADEASMVHQALAGWPHFRHVILVWEHEDQPSSRLQEMARSARYGLMADYCKANDINFLYVAHHAGDQAETVLFRLAKGSGIDGLGAMRPLQQRGELTLCRPLLDISKNDLIGFCEDSSIPFVHDPSNTKAQYARIRLRQSMSVLGAEGLTEKRLGVMVRRMQRASEALCFYADSAYEISLLIKNTDRIEFNINMLLNYPEEIIFRVVRRAMQELLPREDYGARTDRIENLVGELISDTPFKARTLGGMKFEKTASILRISLE